MHVHCTLDTSSVWRICLQPDDSGRSAISAPGLAALEQILQQAQQSPDCRVLLLEGSHGLFCEGMDLNVASVSPQDMQAGIHQFARMLLALRQTPHTTIALVDGVVRAGGIGLVAACDIVLATETSTFGLPEANLGLLPAMVLPLLLERMPAQKARHWIITAQTLQASDAHHLGLVDHVVENSQHLDKQLRHQLRQILRAHPQAIADLKTLSHRMSALSLPDALCAGAEYTASSLDRPEILQGLRMFLAQEPLPWFERYRPTGEKTP